jgi:hypothetical protein
VPSCATLSATWGFPTWCTSFSQDSYLLCCLFELGAVAHVCGCQMMPAWSAWNTKELRFGMVAWARVRALNQYQMYHRLLTHSDTSWHYLERERVNRQPNQSSADSIEYIECIMITLNRELEVMIQLGGPMLVVTCIGMAFLRLLLSISAGPSIAAVELLDLTW